MAYSFPNKVALVTGGASGLGRASALAFAEAGARVMVSDLDEAGGDETVQLIQDATGEAQFMRIDVTKPTEVKALIQATVDSYGQLDFALNNAGIAGPRINTADYPDDQWQRVIDVNLNGVWYCMKAEIGQMLRQGQGVIVNLASISGLIGSPRLSAYAASKHAVIGLTKTAALEYVRKGIRINAICPAYSDTPMVQSMFENAAPEFKQRLLNAIPAQRLGTPQEIAAAVMYLCSNDAGFMVGQALVLDGGIVAG